MRAEQEFADFARARMPHLYRSAWLLCGDPHRAEDLTQETLAKVYAKWGPRLQNPAAYAHTALVRTYISAQRRRSNHERPTEHLPERVVTGPEHDDGAATRLTLAAALDRLAALERAVLVMRYLDDISVADTAAALGVTPQAVRNRTLRALDRLRAVLGTSLDDLIDSGGS